MSYEEISAKHVTGRKDYACEWCMQSIAKGERHFVRAYRWEGEFNNGRMHLECEKAMDDSPRERKIEGWTPGDPKRGETL